VQSRICKKKVVFGVIPVANTVPVKTPAPSDTNPRQKLILELEVLQASSSVPAFEFSSLFSISLFPILIPLNPAEN
jgi:hypothetical protein